MKLHILVIRDRAADVFGQPYFSTSIGAAVRSFSDEINRSDANNSLFKHPGDFDLYHLGTYDDSDGSFDCHPPRQVAIGKDVVRHATTGTVQ